MDATVISTTEAARHLGDYLSRVKHKGEHILLIGKTTGWLGASAYLESLAGREEGAPPPVDLSEPSSYARTHP